MSGSSLTQPELDDAIADAEARGFEVVRANDRTLLLDLDDEEAVATYRRVLPLLQERFEAVATDWKSKSGNTHVKIALGAPLPWAVRYALEAALGSDGVRQVLAVLQMQNGCDEASVLFKPTAESARLAAELPDFDFA